MAHRTTFVGFIFVCTAAALACGSQTGTSQSSGPTAPSSSNTTQACRTYAAAGTSVTTSSAFTATQTFTYNYDANTHQTTLVSSVSDTRGLRQNWTQVTTWRSTADFVDEINVVPPLTLWTGTTATGDAVFTWTNSYDSQGRLTGFTSIQVGGTITVRYTAWDASGRPTTGTMTGPASTSTLALAYDNAGRTLTTTTTTNGLVGVIVQTFDANGNSTVSQSTITGGLPSTTTTTIQSTTKVCK